MKKSLFISRGLCHVMVLGLMGGFYSLSSNPFKAEPSPPSSLLLGGGPSLMYINETSPKQDYSVQYMLVGAQVQALYAGSCPFAFHGSLGYFGLESLTVNDRKIALENRTQSYFAAQAGLSFEVLSLLSLGAGLDGLMYTSLYFKGQKAPDSSGRDLYFAIFAHSKQEILPKLFVTGNFRMALNLTPGNPDVVGINNLVGLMWVFHIGLLYQVF